jgi:hypothetical protein
MEVFFPDLSKAGPPDRRRGEGTPEEPTRRSTTMRFMMLVKANEQSEAGVMPSLEELNEMGRYNEQLVKAGILLAGEGLHPSSKGARIDFDGEEPTVIDGPFAETKELIAGFWLIQVSSKEEAIEWAKRVPFRQGVLELRQVFESSDFAEVDPGIVAKEDALRERMAGS